MYRNADIKEPLSQYQCHYIDTLWAPQVTIFIDWRMKKVAKEMIRRPKKCEDVSYEGSDIILELWNWIIKLSI